MGSNIVNAERSKARAGERVGRLVLVEGLRSDKNRRSVFKCLCDCGAECEKDSSALRKGSCGCLGKEKQLAGVTKHGGARRAQEHPMYSQWRAMRTRCVNENHTSFEWYGGKGVTVCSRWDSFSDFKEDMGPTWFDGATIDRIDSSAGYAPENCRWLTQSENSRRAALAKWDQKLGREGVAR